MAALGFGAAIKTVRLTPATACLSRPKKPTAGPPVDPIVPGSILLPVVVSPEAEGFPADSRWLSAATPPDH